MAQTPSLADGSIDAMKAELKSNPKQFQLDYSRSALENLARDGERKIGLLRSMLATAHTP